MAAVSVEDFVENDEPDEVAVLAGEGIFDFLDGAVDLHLGSGFGDVQAGGNLVVTEVFVEAQFADFAVFPGEGGDGRLDFRDEFLVVEPVEGIRLFGGLEIEDFVAVFDLPVAEVIEASIAHCHCEVGAEIHLRRQRIDMLVEVDEGRLHNVLCRVHIEHVIGSEALQPLEIAVV